jgi:hypothetical protein
MQIFRALNIDSSFLVVNSVFFMNSIIFAAGDVFLYKLANNLLGSRGAKIALIYNLFNFKITEVFHKTLTNGAEANLAIISLYFYSKL